QTRELDHLRQSGEHSKIRAYAISGTPASSKNERAGPSLENGSGFELICAMSGDRPKSRSQKNGHWPQLFSFLTCVDSRSLVRRGGFAAKLSWPFSVPKPARRGGCLRGGFAFGVGFALASS